MSTSGRSTAVFGAFDGMTSVIGVIMGLLSAGSPSIVRACVGLAVASAFGMGCGEYLGDERRDTGTALVMAGATLAGTLVPVIPFIAGLSGGPAVALSAVMTLALGGAIATSRSRFESTVRAWVETFSILAAVTGITIAVAALTGAVG